MPFYDIYFPAMLNYIGDSHPGVRQAAAYGIGVSSQFAGQRFAPNVSGALEALFRVVSLPESRNEDNAHATENAISAIGKICRNYGDRVDVARVLPLWISCLPVLEDKIESHVVYEHLCFFLENSPFQQLLFGSSPDLNTKILSIFAQIIGTDLISDTHNGRILSLLKTWHLFCPDKLSQAFESLPDEQKGKLQKAQNPA